jgi:hypothetical protein
MKKYVKKILFVLSIIASVIVCDMLHLIATEQRGYEAVGGEIMILFVPAILWLCYRNYKDFKEDKQ